MSRNKNERKIRIVSLLPKVRSLRAYFSLASKKTRRVQSGLGIAIIALSVVTMSGVGSFLSSQPVSAATKAGSMSLADQTLSYAYLNSLQKCIRDGKINDNNSFDGQLLISPQSIDDGTWFRNEAWNNADPSGPSVTHASYLAPGVGTDNGEVTCNTVVKEATKLWGFASHKDLYCSFVKERANGSSCATGNGDFGKDEFIGHQNDFLSVIKKEVYDGKTPSLQRNGGYPGRYLLYLAAFQTGCSAKEAANPSSEFAYKVKIVSDEGKIADPPVTFEGMKHDTKRFVYIGQDLNDVEKTCKQIADEINTYAVAYAEYRGNNSSEPVAPGGGTETTGGSSNGATSCAIDGVGWIICPVVNFLAGLADGSFKILSDSLLRTDVNLVNTDSPTYTAWTVIRNLANVAFVIVFLFIIFSQLTGYGVTNYGVKKMLPRLIIAAILVNLSYFICQIAVDISNILGYSIKDALGGVGNSIVEASKSLDGVSPFANGDGFLGIAGGILAIAAGGVIIYAMLSALIPVLLAVVLALVMILFILIARQALVVILIVLAPLAFVAFLLPNTENFFKMWRKALTAMLLLFPIIALVFGLSSLASDIISMTFSGDLGNTEANNWFGQIVAAAVLVLPLFVVPLILKKSLDGIPMLGQMASRFQGKANARVGKKLSGSYQGSRFALGRRFREQRRATDRTLAMGGEYTGKNPALRAQSAVSGALNSSPISGKFGDRLAAQGIAVANKEEAESISAIEQQLRRDSVTKPGTVDQALKDALVKGDIAKVKAAQNVMFSQGSSGAARFHSAVSSVQSSASADALNAARENINTNHGQYVKAKAYDITKWAATGGDIDDVKHTKDFSTLSEADLASQTGATLQRAMHAINPATAQALLANKQLNGNLDADQLRTLKQAASGTFFDPSRTAQPNGAAAAAVAANPTAGSAPTTINVPPASSSNNPPTPPPAAGFVVNSQGIATSNDGSISIPHDNGPTPPAGS